MEPVKGNSKSPKAGTVTDQRLGATQSGNVQPRNIASVGADTEKGRAPSGNRFNHKWGRVTVLTLEILEELVKDPEIRIPVTEAEIMHTSKGDPLSKAIFILQSSWFIMQCIARWIQGLNLTHLELTTLALASLNGITLVLWWDKPLGTQALVRVYLNRKLTDVERNVEGVSDFFPGAPTYSDPQLQRGQSGRSKLVPNLQNNFENTLTSIRDIILGPLSDKRKYFCCLVDSTTFGHCCTSPFPDNRIHHSLLLHYR